MDNLKIEGMFPSSISQISLKNEESQFGGVSIAQHKHQIQKLSDYHIKINGPDTRQPDPRCQYDEKDKQDKYSFINNQTAYQQNIMPHADQVEFKDKVNGFQHNKDAFSEEQILKAFNIIDINKDNVITEDDLMFVLDYLKQQYTIQQVRQMISMLCADKKHVTFEQFKKLGRGDIVPLAKLNLSDPKRKNKAQILNNIERSQLMNENPAFLIQCLRKDLVSYNKFEQSKKTAKNAIQTSKVTGPQKDKLFMVVPILPLKQFKQRQHLFNDIVLASIEDLYQNYQQYKQKTVNLNKIATILQISVKQARQLYPKVQSTIEVSSLLIIMQAIAYSQISMVKKLSYCLELCNNKNTITISELTYLLQIIKGKDESIQKKIKAIVASKDIKFDQSFPKNVAYEIVLEYINKIFGVN